eukprot:7697972-Alexandrium_andersonii.AAC.1
MPCLAEVAIQKGIVRRKSQTEAWAAAEVVKMAFFLHGLRLAIKHGKAPNEFYKAVGSSPVELASNMVVGDDSQTTNDMDDD